MPISHIPYDLCDGYLHHWLVAGPQSISVDMSQGRAAAGRAHYSAESHIENRPVEPGPLDESSFTVGDYEGLWLYAACGEDHFVDLSAAYAGAHFLRGWAYVEVMAPSAREVTLIVSTCGPADLWLNGTHIHRSETFGFHHEAVAVELDAGANPLLVRFEQVGAGSCLHQVALRITGATDGVKAQLPTAVQDVALRNQLAEIFAAAHLDRDLFIWDEFFSVYWPDDLEPSDVSMIRLQTPSGRIYAESRALVSPGESFAIVRAHDAPQGPLRLRFLPRLELFYDEGVRVQREIPVWGAGWQTYATTPDGTPAERRVVALRHAIRGAGLFADVARMALGLWDILDRPGILRAIESVGRHDVDSQMVLVGLVGMLYRWGDDAAFPAGIREALEACLRTSAGWDVTHAAAASDPTEILAYTSEMLAGQLYPDRTFAASGQTGAWHRERAERRALAWLRRCGTEGFGAWDAGGAFEAVLVALSHLIDLSETEAIWQMAAVILDKVLITMALNSFQGVFGGTQGALDVSALYGGPLSRTSGITRLIWGQGLYNHHLAGLVSIACMEDYSLPPLIPEIAVASRDELWNRECHVAGDGTTVNKVTYRTPDYLLASAQDYRPGEPGARVHPWQATLGPRAVVYTTHPASVGKDAGHAPGFWLGNATLPRVAQWRDVLFSIYRLPDDDWMGFTHAYFPTFAFDETSIQESAAGQVWAFACKDAGYLALTSSPRLVSMSRGPGAYRELRAYGEDAIWVCQMGRAAVDGDFASFQTQVLAQPLTFEAAAVRYGSLRGEMLSFGWEGPLLRDGEAVSLAGFPHYDNAYCVMERGATEMEIRSENYLMRLQFGQRS